MSALIAAIVSGLFTGGLLLLLTMTSQKRKITAEANTAEANTITAQLKNLEGLCEFWSITAQNLTAQIEKQRAENAALAQQVEILTDEVSHLTTINERILNLLDKLTPENVEQIKGEIRKTIKKNEK